MKIIIKSKFGNYTVENIKISFKKIRIIFFLSRPLCLQKDIKKKLMGKIIVLNTAEKLKDYYEIGKL